MKLKQIELVTVTKYITTMRYLHFKAFEGKIISIKFTPIDLISWQPFLLFIANKSPTVEITVMEGMLSLLFSLHKCSLRIRSNSSVVREALVFGAMFQE